MFPIGVSYEEAQRRFQWRIAERYNMRRMLCERHPPQLLALTVENADGPSGTTIAPNLR